MPLVFSARSLLWSDRMGLPGEVSVWLSWCRNIVDPLEGVLVQGEGYLGSLGSIGDNWGVLVCIPDLLPFSQGCRKRVISQFVRWLILVICRGHATDLLTCRL